MPREWHARPAEYTGLPPRKDATILGTFVTVAIKFVNNKPPTKGERPRIWAKRIPKLTWVALTVLFGAILGLGGFTFIYADGFSYLGSNPKTCANCHVMQDAYDGWSHSSHKSVAHCVDCHAPHNVVEKYAVKGISGAKDMVAFTLDIIPDPIHIRSFSKGIVQDQCIYCHQDMVEPISYAGSAHPTDCLRCHARVGHDY
jgi:cytochrome c nitrite reductase small subunit